MSETSQEGGQNSKFSTLDALHSNLDKSLGKVKDVGARVNILNNPETAQPLQRLRQNNEQANRQAGNK